MFTRIAWSLLVAAAALPALAAPLELEIFTDERVPISGRQEWLERLAKAGVADLRIRAKDADDKVGVEMRGTAAQPVYVVTGMLDSSNELTLPGGRFKLGQAAAVAKHLESLARKPATEEAPSAFGLPAADFARLRKGLAATVDFSTKGRDRHETARRIARLAPVLIAFDPSAAEALADDPLAEELSGLAVGSALAYVVRSGGLRLAPRGTSGGLQLAVMPADPTGHAWPIGWPLERPAPEVLPALYEAFNANLDKVDVSRVLAALAPRLKASILVDHNALARHGIEPEKILVSFPQARTTHNNLLRKALGQARLKYELRVDEAGSPLLWVTTVKPL